MFNRVLSTEVLAIIVRHGELIMIRTVTLVCFPHQIKMSILDSSQALHMGKAAMNRKLYSP